MINWRNVQVSQPVPLLQLLTRSDPFGGHDVRLGPVVAAQRRRSAVRTRDRICRETCNIGGTGSDHFCGVIRRLRVSRMRAFRHRRWHLDEVFVKINGVRHYLWHTVDDQDEILQS